MSGCFRDALWLGRRLTFPEINMVWKIIEKRHDDSETESEAEAELSSSISCGDAEFLVVCEDSPDIQAYLRVVMQLPFKGTELDPASTRATQARTDNPPTWPYDELEAWKRLSTLSPPVTAVLLGSFEEPQGPEGVVPGGWCHYILISKPPGDQLGTGISILQGEHFCPEGIFWTFDSPTRDLIRAKFEAGYRRLEGVGVRPLATSLKCLYWDAAREGLYFHSSFAPIGPPFLYSAAPFSARKVGLWGLAKSTGNSKFLRYRGGDVTVEELMANGWKF